MPCFIASSGFLILIVLPFILTVPPVILSAPNIARTDSLRPEPRSPVKPFTSPFFIEKSKGAMPALLTSPFASNTEASPFDSCSVCCGLSISDNLLRSLPSIFETSSTLGRSAALYSPTNLPSRSTVILSQTAYTWSRKCVTNIIPTPRLLRSSISLNSFSTSCSSSEEVGSSRISTLQSISTARAIATIC